MASAAGNLTVAVTGPTGDIGRALLRRLERETAVARVIGMARRPFDPASQGLAKAEYRRGDVLDRASVEGLVDEADVVVHLAFIILGSPEEAREVNLRGSRNVFDAAAAAGVKRLLYTSSVAAYGFHSDNPQPLTENLPVRGSDELYYSTHKAELERVFVDALAGTAVDGYVFRPCIVAGPDARTFVETVMRQYQLGGRLPLLQRALEEAPFMAPVLPDPGIPIQLVHHDDVATALAAAVRGDGAPGPYNLAADGAIRMRDLARELGWWHVPVPRTAISALAEAVKRAPLLPPEAKWIQAARVPMLMDTAKARRELGWTPQHDAAQTLSEMVSAARAEPGLLR